jgi:AraC-like DNA-binding protein
VDFRAHRALPPPPDPAALLLCGSYPLDADGASPLLAALPPVVRVSTGDSEAVRLTMALLAAEVDQGEVGADLAVDRLVDLMLVHLLRVWLAQGPAQGGWLAALADPHVGRALERLHADPGRRWTVAAMGREAGLSRAAFARRFGDLVGEPPLAYLTRWRMTVAARLLRETRLPLAAVADQVGYDSEFAFARAFKRHRHAAPGRYRAAVAAA